VSRSECGRTSCASTRCAASGSGGLARAASAAASSGAWRSRGRRGRLTVGGLPRRRRELARGAELAAAEHLAGGVAEPLALAGAAARVGQVAAAGLAARVVVVEPVAAAALEHVGLTLQGCVTGGIRLVTHDRPLRVPSTCSSSSSASLGGAAVRLGSPPDPVALTVGRLPARRRAPGRARPVEVGLEALVAVAALAVGRAPGHDVDVTGRAGGTRHAAVTLRVRRRTRYGVGACSCQCETGISRNCGILP
jgi:hypothetical protein